MTDLTRRDALMLTAVIAATTSTVLADPAPAPAQPLTRNDDLLIPPVNTVASSSIPITVKIKESVFAAGGATLTNLAIAMTLSDGQNGAPTSILTTTLQGLALPPAGAKSPISDIVLMTRLKIPSDPKAAAPVVPAPPPPAGAAPVAPTANPAASKTMQVTAAISFSYSDATKNNTVNASQQITVNVEDCALSDVSLLRLSLQPALVPPNAAMMVRAVVPPAPAPVPATGAPRVPTHKLKTIVGSSAKLPAAGPAPAPAAQPDFQMVVTDDKYLSDEVFVGFNLYPPDSNQFVMDWSYEPVDKGATFDLKASAYAAVIPAKA
jgi:hypothetical protein